MRAIVAEFARQNDMMAAARAAFDARVGEVEAYGPFPLPDVASRQNLGIWIVPVISMLAAVTGAVGTYGLQYWMNAVDYPLNVGGRPLHSWPAFIPASIIVGVLAGAGATLIGMLILCGLPALHHPMFDIPGFERASQDRFFLRIAVGDDAAAGDRARVLLEAAGPLTISEVGG